MPFLDREIQKVARSLSFDQMVRDGELKWALKNAFADILPEDILRRPKHGFNVPIDYWLKGKWKFLIDETFSVNSCLFKEGLISENALGMAYDLLEDKKSFHGHTIFCYIILNIWLKEVHHGNNC